MRSLIIYPWMDEAFRRPADPVDIAFVRADYSLAIENIAPLVLDPGIDTDEAEMLVTLADIEKRINFKNVRSAYRVVRETFDALKAAGRITLAEPIEHDSLKIETVPHKDIVSKIKNVVIVAAAIDLALEAVAAWRAGDTSKLDALCEAYDRETDYVNGRRAYPRSSKKLWASVIRCNRIPASAISGKLRKHMSNFYYATGGFAALKIVPAPD